MPDNASVKSFGGTEFIYANKSNSPQEKLLLEPLNPPILSGTQYGIVSDSTTVIKTTTIKTHRTWYNDQNLVGQQGKWGREETRTQLINHMLLGKPFNLWASVFPSVNCVGWLPKGDTIVPHGKLLSVHYFHRHSILIQDSRPSSCCFLCLTS